MDMKDLVCVEPWFQTGFARVLGAWRKGGEMGSHVDPLGMRTGFFQ